MNLPSLFDQYVWLITIVAFILTVVATIIAFKTLKGKKPCYSIRSFNLVNSLISKVDLLKISYSDKTIDNVTISKILFWNDGHETIDKSDITSLEPLFIVPKGNKQILDAKIVYSKESANNFSLEKPEGEKDFRLEFDYIDKNQGAIIQIIHTGKSSKDLEINGKLKGAGKPELKPINNPAFKYPYLSFRKSHFIMCVILLLVGLIPGFFIIIVPDLPSPIKIMFVVFVSIAIGTAFVLFKSIVPKGFERFYDDF